MHVHVDGCIAVIDTEGRGEKEYVGEGWGERKEESGGERERCDLK